MTAFAPPPFPPPDDDLTGRIRDRIVSAIHGRQLNPGDRLPRYREVAEEFGVDLRRVARAYRQLESEGLVEVRSRSGVFVAPQERIGGEVLAETARWMVQVLADAWSRRMALGDFPDFVRRCIATVPVRCACIDATVDQREALCTELRDEFGFDTFPVDAGRLPPAGEGGRAPELDGADLLVTTVYHAGVVREWATALDKPTIVVQLDCAMLRRLLDRLETGELTVVCVDLEFVERVRRPGARANGGSVRGVAVADQAALAALPRDELVMITGAAKRRLSHGNLPLALVFGPALSRETAHELIEALLRFNLEAIRSENSEE